MTALEDCLSGVQDWCEEALLRGLDQLGPAELVVLERRAAAAAELQLTYLAELLVRVAETGRSAMLGGGSSHELVDAYCLLSQYVLLAQQQSLD
ncbi:hypothetical protein [Paenibacillus daejeonensis]|uniref:hypothetical protein n=1 Tax=Paenibacillus daejeonensis TaxID=135193 RepID=UPI00036F4123|nr:hypothetical protein [Paenibacillus daejeonensis]